MAVPETQSKISDNPSASRYEMTLEGEAVGFLDYRSSPGLMVLAYVEIDPRFGGRGLGGELTSAALNDCRARGVAVAVECPFISRYIRSHPEYADLLAR